MIIKEIDAIPLNMRFKSDLQESVLRSGLRTGKGRVTLYRVELIGGAIGYGEALNGPDDVAAFVGQNAVAGLRTIRHAGVQMALFDAVGHALNVPAHQLMGRQVRDNVPFAYWSCDLSPEEWAEQVQQAATSARSSRPRTSKPSS